MVGDSAAVEKRLARIVVAVGLYTAALALMCGAPARAHAVDVQTSVFISICGDGVVQADETCDNGAGFNYGTYASSTTERTCSPDCHSFGPYCGDGILQVRFGEQCDDGNNVSGDLCSATCIAEPPAPPAGGPGGSPTVGSTPYVPGATPGAIPSDRETKVVLRGKASPGSTVNILLDGKSIGVVQADANADFLFSTNTITPGTATFSFWAHDIAGTDSLTTSMVFDVAQSAVTTLSNIFIPPTMVVSSKQIAPGGLLTLSGYAPPSASIASEVNPDTAELSSTADTSGKWALQIDTGSLKTGFHTVKSLFALDNGIKSGYGKAVSFYIGNGTAPVQKSADLNHDGKVNLIDFSIFLTNWDTDDFQSDLNSDGKVNLADFSIMLFDWTG